MANPIDYVKDPDAVLDYSWDWTSWLQGGETITTSDFTASAGITIESDSNTASRTTVWLSGGSVGSPYIVTNEITTSLGRTDDRSITIRVQQR